ncbi:DUF2141 domain-containing protein [Xenophilus sp.]|jgi:uncharacterized protein (DUF2141 family)|uniref:DUF2141 domain-containing protein n=1 Tax=Xenophilus sp. TaxID=1873499 RepID=UPI0037DD7B2D
MRLPSILFSAALLGPLAAGAADLQVSVADGPAGPAQLYVAVYDSAERYAAGQSMASQSLPLREGAAQLAFVGLPAGRYALKVFADENGNGKLDTNLLGLPVERYGFSRDARGDRGAPDFEAVAVPLDADQRITIHLR